MAQIKIAAIILVLTPILGWSQSINLPVGEITYTCDTTSNDWLSYYFTASIYHQDTVVDDSITIRFHHGNESESNRVPLTSVDSLCGPFNRYNYSILHQFTVSGDYVVQAFDSSAVLGLINWTFMPSAQLVLETHLSVGPDIANNSAQFQQPPIFYAQLGQNLTHQLGAEDTDGRNLVYNLFQSNFIYELPPQVKINSHSGEFRWNAPTEVGKHLFFLNLKENVSPPNTKYLQVRNFIVDVREDLNLPQFLGTKDWPKDDNNFFHFYKAPGDNWSLDFVLEGNAAKMEVIAYGEAFGLSVPPVFTSSQVANQVLCNLSWAVNSSDLRERPYVFTFAGSAPSDSLCPRNDLVLSVQVVNDVSLGNQPDSDSEYLTIFPNPSQGETSIQVNGGSIGKLVILDITGKPVLQFPLVPGQRIIRINSVTLAPGVYFCSLQVDGNVLATKKMVVLK